METFKALREEQIKKVLEEEKFSPGLIQHLQEATARHVGDITELEQAIGAVFVAKLYGWRVLRLIHNAKTVKKFERILGIHFQELCKDETMISDRSLAFSFTKTIGKFWDVVNSRIKVPGDRKILVGYKDDN